MVIIMPTLHCGPNCSARQHASPREWVGPQALLSEATRTHTRVNCTFVKLRYPWLPVLKGDANDFVCLIGHLVEDAVPAQHYFWLLLALWLLLACWQAQVSRGWLWYSKQG